MSEKTISRYYPFKPVGSATDCSKSGGPVGEQYSQYLCHSPRDLYEKEVFRSCYPVVNNYLVIFKSTSYNIWPASIWVYGRVRWKKELGISKTRVSSKRTKKISVRTETNRNKICFGCVSVCFVKAKTKNSGLFRCFEPTSKQNKQTELFRNNPKQLPAKVPKYALYQTVSVALLFVSVQSEHRNSLFRLEAKQPKQTFCFG